MYHLGGDLDIVSQLETPEVILASEQQKKVKELYATLSLEYPFQKKRDPLTYVKTPNPCPLRPDESEIARKFAERVSLRYDLSPMLEAFKKGPYNEFRPFVRQTTWQLGLPGVTEKDLIEQLESRFNSEVAELSSPPSPTLGNLMAFALGGGAVLADKLLGSRRPAKHMHRKPTKGKYSRREILRLLVAGTVGLGVYNIDHLSRTLTTEYEEWHRPEIGWISLIVSRAKTKGAGAGGA